MISIDDDVFGYNEDLGYSSETFLVTGYTQPDAVLDALEKAAARFVRVDGSGAEHRDQESVVSAVEAGVAVPSYVSDPRITDAGIEVYVDCSGAVEPPMAERLRAILREELDAAGVTGRVRAVD